MANNRIPIMPVRGRSSSARPLGVVAAAVAAGALTVAAAEQAAGPSIPDDLRAAMAQADEGNPAELARLADTGRADAHCVLHR